MRVDQNFKGCRGAHEVNSKALMQPCLLGNCCLVFDAYLLRHPPVRIKIYEHTQILQQKILVYTWPCNLVFHAIPCWHLKVVAA